MIRIKNNAYKEILGILKCASNHASMTRITLRKWFPTNIYMYILEENRTKILSHIQDPYDEQ
jgi:hypothetical protein